MLNKSFLLISLVTAYVAHAALKIENMAQLPEKSPFLLGGAAFYGPMLSNIRFYGNYGPVKKGFLCHRQVATGDLAKVTDCPQDYTTSVVQLLFPSPGGGRLALPGGQRDVFYLFAPKDFSNLIESLSKLSKESDLEKIKESLQKFFDNHIKSNKKTRDLESDWKDSLEAQSIKPDLATLIKSYVEMLAGAMAEQKDGKYPLGTIPQGLAAFVWQKYGIKDLLDKNSKTDFSFSPESYKKWKDSSLTIIDKESKDEKVSVTDKAFKELLEHPNELIFNTLAYDKYDNSYPPLLGTAKSSYEDPKTGNSYVFSDCGEASLRNAFNAFLADPEKKNFDVSVLDDKFPQHEKSLNWFYKLQPSYNEVVDGMSARYQAEKEGHVEIKLRDAWAKVVSGLTHVEYGKDYGGVCNIDGGVDNILGAFVSLLNDEELEKLWKSKSKDETTELADKRRADMMTYVLTKFSRDGFTLSFANKDQKNDSLNNDSTITILVDDEPTFRWLMSPGHYEFELIQQGFLDWRKNESLADFIAKSSLSDVDRNWLLPFYIDLKMSFKNLESFTPILLYAFPLSGAEDKIKTLSIALKYDHTVAKEIVSKWLESIPDDRVLNSKIRKLISDHKKIFDANFFTIESFPRLYPLYWFDNVRLIKSSEKDREDFLVDITKKMKPEYIPKGALFDAVARGYVGLIDALCKAFPEVISKDKFLRDDSGYTPLHRAAEKGTKDVVKELLKKGEVRDALLKDSEINVRNYYGPNNREGQNPLDLAINRAGWDAEGNEKKAGPIIEVFLEDEGAREAFLNERDKVSGSSPLHFAASVGNIPILKLMLKYSKYIKEDSIEDDDGESPLFVAVRAGDADAVKILLGNEHIRNLCLNHLRIKENNKFTALHKAVREENLAVIKALLERDDVAKVLLSKENILDGFGRLPVRLEGYSEAQKVLTTDEDITKYINTRIEELKNKGLLP